MKKFLLGLLSGLLCLLTATAASLALLCGFDWLYRFDLRALDIPGTSGYTADQALENYHAVMNYLSPFENKPFSLPGMVWSENGASHFADCKVIFLAVYCLGILSLILLICTSRARRCAGSMAVWRIGGVFTLVIPLVIGGFLLFDFEQTFVTFHKIFFRNDNWIFYEDLDPVIKILPEQFFLHCGLFIAAFWVLAAVLEFIAAAHGTLSAPKNRHTYRYDA